MFGNQFQMISSSALQVLALTSAFSSVVGFPGAFQGCNASSNSWLALCFGAACQATPYTNTYANGVNRIMSVTCYCPVYKQVSDKFVITGSKDHGFSCSGQGPYINGVPSYVQNGV
jgi:hypothetical protein